MNNTFYLLRHGATKIDKNIPVSKWTLSDVGRAQAEKVASETIFTDLDLLFSSTEKKAYTTILPLSKKLDKKIIKLKDLCELDRDKGSFMESTKYEETIKLCLEKPNNSFNNWETANHALERFSKQIDKLDREHIDRKILIAGHGFTINMYFAKLLKELDKVYERMSRNDFADWGIVKDQKVIQDIANY